MNAIRASAAAIAFCAIVAASAATAQESPLAGTFVNDGQSNDAIGKAIETAVAQMNFIKRPIARSRLKKTNPLYQRIEISRTATEVAVRFDAGKPVVMPADGRTVKWTRDDGEQFDVTGMLREQGLVQTFVAEDGKRVNTFSIDPDGKLVLQVTLTSPQLPTPVSYQLVYRRPSH
jgi:hypothetical protein